MKKLTTEEFIFRSNKIHNNIYDYSKSIYTSSKEKIKIICTKHGGFEQIASSHLQGRGCFTCNKDLILLLKLNKFKEKANHIHKNKYDYSKSEYVNSHVKTKIICSKHGEFQQEPYQHLNGCGCPSCSNRKKINNSEFIKRAEKIHGDKYDYSLINCNGVFNQINIICKSHGVFKQSIKSHLRGEGCIVCAKRKPLTNIEFIERAKIVHGDKYCYDNIKYLNINKKIKISCKKHGIFKQTPKSHLNGSGCPICNESKGEKIIRNFLIKNDINFKSQKIFDDCKNKLPLPFDFYVPQKNLLIEFDGIQHFKSIDFFGGDESFIKLQKNDRIKNEYANKSKINLLRIKYNELSNIENILNNKL